MISFFLMSFVRFTILLLVPWHESFTIILDRATLSTEVLVFPNESTSSSIERTTHTHEPFTAFLFCPTYHIQSPPPYKPQRPLPRSSHRPSSKPYLEVHVIGTCTCVSSLAHRSRLREKEKRKRRRSYFEEQTFLVERIWTYIYRLVWYENRRRATQRLLATSAMSSRVSSLWERMEEKQSIEIPTTRLLVKSSLKKLVQQ